LALPYDKLILFLHILALGQYLFCLELGGIMKIRVISLVAIIAALLLGVWPAVDVVLASAPSGLQADCSGWSFDLTNLTGGPLVRTWRLYLDGSLVVSQTVTLPPPPQVTMFFSGDWDERNLNDGQIHTALLQVIEDNNEMSVDFGGYGNPAIAIEKFTNEQDADTPPGPYIAVGGPVIWKYVVTNIGDVSLTNIVVTDNILEEICTVASLGVNQSALCTASGFAEAGPYENVGTVTGYYGDAMVTASDPSHYFGAMPAIAIKKFTNGKDANNAPGPSIPVGDAVTWEYIVTNAGNVRLTNIAVTDDKRGDICTIAELAAGASATCTDSGVAAEGPYANIGTATANYNNTTVTASDSSHYFGFRSAYSFQKSINGQDADTLADAVHVNVNESLTILYAVTNTGNIPLVWAGLTDDVLGNLTSKCSLPKTIEAGKSGSCQVIYLAENHPEGKQNIGAASVEGLSDQTDLAWYITPPPVCNCTYTQGYWKNHEEAWLVDTLMLGTRTYPQTQLLSILEQPVQGNGLISLAHQLIAAKLNIAKGASAPAGVTTTITSADTLIGGLVIPPIGSGYLVPSATNGLTNALDDYNKGVVGPGHCTDEPIGTTLTIYLPLIFRN
jgi:hypothetical protein